MEAHLLKVGQKKVEDGSHTVLVSWSWKQYCIPWKAHNESRFTLVKSNQSNENQEEEVRQMEQGQGFTP